MLKYYQNMIKYIQRENLIDIRRQYMDVGVKSQSKQKKPAPTKAGYGSLKETARIR